MNETNAACTDVDLSTGLDGFPVPAIVDGARSVPAETLPTGAATAVEPMEYAS
ncbi:hypothetical protein [Streptomyces sp900105755]|uniref:Uncharacterized protein n=1 Tax=Streptomyces sp. 900105755 TaxID=3154389 RepID=A0ABV1TVZ8_9ACTN